MNNDGIFHGLSRRDKARVRQVAADAGLSCSDAIGALAISYIEQHPDEDLLRPESVRNGQEPDQPVFRIAGDRNE